MRFTHCIVIFTVFQALLVNGVSAQSYADMLASYGIDPNAVRQAQAQQNAQMAQMFAVQPTQLPILSRRPGENQSFPTDRVDFGYFTIEVPQGWSAEALAGSVSNLSHMVQATSPDVRFQILYATDWYTFYDSQTGGYLPGNQVMERQILPIYQQAISPYQIEGIVNRSQNTRTNDPLYQSLGMIMPLDAGTVQFTIRSPQGEQLWGEGYAQTRRMFEDTTGLGIGLYSVPLCGIVVAPGDQSSLNQALSALQHMRASIRLDGQASQAWLQASRSANQSAAQGAADRSRMTAQHGEEMRQMQRETWEIQSQSSDYIGQISTNAIRGGEYMTDPTTGQEHWTDHTVDHWWVNPEGTVVGTEIQEPPTLLDQWTPLESQVLPPPW
jgi:hypothetical protein